MLFPVSYTSTLSSLFFLVLICLLLIISHGSFTAADGHENISIGAIIDDKSRAGKEQKTAMKIAVQNFNSNSSNHKFTIHFRNNSGDPLQAAVAAEQLIKDEEVQVIIGTQTWQEAALVADIGSRAQVPLISLAAAAITPPLTQIRWPFLAQMATNSSQEMKREKIYSNFTKIVVVVWLFVVLILSSSYTASLSSMLTVPKLEPKVKEIEWLRKTNAVVGCDEDSFVKDYLKNILHLKNLKTITNQDDYPKEFDSGAIKAAFLELPYLKVFQEEYNGYTTAGPSYRFGGLGFAFQKGSPIATDVSEAILTISENGVLKGLEKKWFPSSQNYSNSPNQTDSLALKSFWGIYLISGVTSTVCLLIFLMKLLFKKYSNKTEANQENAVPSEVGAWRKALELVRYLRNKESRISPAGRAPSFKHAQDKEEWRSSSRWELVSPSETAEHPVRPTQIEVPIWNDLDYIVNHSERR